MTTKERVTEIADYAQEWGVEQTAIDRNVKPDTVRSYISASKKHAQSVIMEDVPDHKKPVLIIPDLHAPYNHSQAIPFLKWVYEVRGCRKRVVGTGDIMDFHSMSRHVHETDASSPTLEYRKALEFTAEFCEAFPEGDLVLGNHDLIPQRQMKEIGLPSSLLVSHNSLYGMSDGWKIHPLYHVIDPDGWDVLVEHGIGSGGKYGCANTAKEKRCSYVQGHTHSAAAVIYSTNHESTIFGMNVGCLVDSDSLAMRYGKYGTRKGVLGCGVVYSGSHAEFVPMSSWPELNG